MAKYRDFDDDFIYDDEDWGDEIKEKRPKASTKAKSSSRPKKKKNKKKKRVVLIAVVILEVFVLIMGCGIYYVASKFSQIGFDDLDREKIVINDDLDENTQETLKGYTNILLLGSDARDNDPDVITETGESHTDSMIIASINNETKEVKLVSLYRDTLLYIPKSADSSEFIYSKATEAMFLYGLESTISMFNSNLDLDIQEYVMVNWDALIEIIDAVGGIDIEINDTELYWLNEYLRDTGANTGRTYTEVAQSGYVHLDGIQATAYCRIRYGGGSDYRRTERQRTVLSLVFEQAKKMGVTKLDAAINAVVDNVVTSMDGTEIFNMAKSIASYELVDQSGFPFELTDQVKEIIGLTVTDPVIAIDLEQNVSELHEYLFGVIDYQPSATVQEISDKIITMTGVK